MQPIIKKIVDAKEALEKISDNAVVAVSGFNMATAPDYLLRKLYELYESTGHPQNLFIESDTFSGAPGRGIDFIAEKIYKDPDQKFIRGVLMPFL
jgi:acyl CoA:acetate/3-ketoacid CoA transferase